MFVSVKRLKRGRGNPGKTPFFAQTPRGHALSKRGGSFCASTPSTPSTASTPSTPSTPSTFLNVDAVDGVDGVDRRKKDFLTGICVYSRHWKRRGECWYHGFGTKE